MVTERKEPTVSSVVDSKEDLANKRPRTPISRQPRIVEKKTSSSGVWAALLLAVVAIGAVCFSYWQLMQAQVVLQDQQARLQNQQARIAELENRLVLSDDESTQSLVVVSAKLKEANSEIRKLWGVSYDTNRKAIGANKAVIDSQAQNYRELDQSLKTQQATLDNSNQRLLEQELVMRALRERVDEQLNRLTSASIDSKKRIENNEEAIKAFDIFRRSVSRDLLQIKQQLKPPAAR